MGDLSEHFSRSEFACPCGKCGLDQPGQDLIDAAELLRHIEGDAPLLINRGGGVRCQAYNTRIGGAVNSRHMLGLAMDVFRPAAQIPALFRNALQIGSLRGFGLSFESNYVHLDVRPWSQRRVLWVYHNSQTITIPYDFDKCPPITAESALQIIFPRRGRT